jgi:AI-2 transport protein TqsA
MLSPVVEPPIRAELHIQTVCLAILTAVAIGFALWWLTPVMIPLVVAAFLAFALMPLVNGLEVHARLPRTLAVCVALLLALLVLAGAGALTSSAVIQVGSNAVQYEKTLAHLFNDITEWPPLKWIGLKQPPPIVVEESPPSAPSETPKGGPRPPDQSSLIQTTAAKQGASSEAKTSPFSLIPESAVQTFLLGTTNAIFGILRQSLVVLVFLFFLLLSSVKRDRPIGGAWGEMESQIRAYLVTMTAISAATGALVGAVLAILGVQAALLFGLLTFLLNFIPNVGSFISAVLPIPIILMAPNFTWPWAIMAIAIPGTIQFVIGTFIQPKMMGDSMKLHPVVILSSLIFWGMLWGFMGAFLAVPITSIIRIACARHPLTRPVANLMAGHLDSLREEPLVVSAMATPE